MSNNSLQSKISAKYKDIKENAQDYLLNEANLKHAFWRKFNRLDIYEDEEITS